MNYIISEIKFLTDSLGIIIALGILLLIAFLIVLIIKLPIMRYNKAVTNLNEHGKYNEALKLTQEYIDMIHNSSFRNDITRKIDWQMLDINIASLNLYLGDNAAFTEHIKKIDLEKLQAIKFFLLTLSDLLNENLESAKLNYEKYKTAPKKFLKAKMFYDSRSQLLSAAIDYYNGETRDVKTRIENNIDKFKNRFLKEFFNNIADKTEDK